MKKLSVLFSMMMILLGLQAAEIRRTYVFEGGWSAVCFPENKERYGDSIVAEDVRLPHNFDDYYGARQLLHGNLHGEAVYDLKFRVFPVGEDLFHRLRIEGAGSYITVVLNGDTLCSHRPSGRIVTTLNLKRPLEFGRTNSLRIICHHPSRITDLPWVCGGCSSEWGFSEGSQPLGLFRAVKLEELHNVHIKPFGVHVWNNASCDTLFVETEIENTGDASRRRLRLETTLTPSNDSKKILCSQTVKFQVKKGGSLVARQSIPLPDSVMHWSPEKPYLYDVRTVIFSYDLEQFREAYVDVEHTEYGFRTIEWGRQFKMDGRPVFINGICEYEHSFGHSHALTQQEIDSRCVLVRQLGYNAFRDAHQPHNLRYQHNWNRLGVVNWSQFSAHIWYDTPSFRENFKTLLRQWVKERRNDPSLVLWGLQNESTLPADFAQECCEIIREMDPTCRQPGNPTFGRLITTCNGGSGTDWNVVQNWSGTYGGKLEKYGEELKRDNQLLNGEYGAWRTVGLHDTLTIFNSKAPHSEEKFSVLLQSKMDQAWASRDSVCGQYLWLMYSHDNPGRYQPDESIRLIDKVGPFNYKGLYTIWEQPTEFAKALLNDTVEASVPGNKGALLFKGNPDMTYLYRYNCGGDSLVDSWGQQWMGDDTRFSTSWAQRPCFAKDSLCPVLASQGRSDAPVSVAFSDETPCLLPDADQPMARSFRWGRQDLKFRFPVPRNKQYCIDVFSIEPWIRSSYGRRYDIAVNGLTYCEDVNLVRISGGRNHLVRTTIHVPSEERDYLEISFPHVAAGQAVVCGIVISMLNTLVDPEMQMPPVPAGQGYPYSAGLTWAQLDTMVLAVTPKGYFPNYDANLSSELKVPAQKQENGSVRFDFQTGLAHEYVMRFRYKNVSEATVGSRWELRSQVDNRIIAQGSLAFPVTPPKWKPVSTTTGSMINAGAYYLVITTDKPLEFESLTIE